MRRYIVNAKMYIYLVIELCVQKLNCWFICSVSDSSLILSPSSSGESLISCDLMLDYKER